MTPERAIRSAWLDLFAALAHSPLCGDGMERQCVCRIVTQRRELRALVELARIAARKADESDEARAALEGLRLRLDSRCKCHMTCDACSECPGDPCACEGSPCW